MDNTTIIKSCTNFHEVFLYEFYFVYANKIIFRNDSSYAWLLLLLSSDVELNPGPVNQHNYSFGHPYLCGFYRIALFDMLNNGKDIKKIFDGYFDISDVDLTKISKNKQRFVQIFTKWGKNRGREDRENYLKTYSTENWLKLDVVDKQKHSVLCNECENSFIQIHVTFPSNSKYFFAEKQKLTALANKSCDDRLKAACDTLKPQLKRVLSDCLSDIKSPKNDKISKKNLQTLTMEISEELDTCFFEGTNNQTNFNESFAKFHQLVPK